jgi:hypothetical protein
MRPGQRATKARRCGLFYLEVRLKRICLVVLICASAVGFGSAATVDPLPIFSEVNIGQWIYFYPEGSRGLILKNDYNQVSSNARIAVKISGRDRKIISSVEMWTDICGNVHTLQVLKKQIEYSHFLEDNTPWDWEYSEPVIDQLVVQITGVLDRETLLIPYEKLRRRWLRLIDHRLGPPVTDQTPEAILTRQYRAAWAQKSKEAGDEIRLIKKAVEEIALRDVTACRLKTESDDTTYGGLSDLPYPDIDKTLVYISTPERNLTILTQRGTGRKDALVHPVEPTAITANVIGKLQELEAAASAKLQIAEDIGRQFFGFIPKPL